MAISSLNFATGEPTLPEIEPKIIPIIISNQSNYTIHNIEVELAVISKGREKLITKRAMNYWNLIFPSQQKAIQFKYYGSPPFTIKKITIYGSLNTKSKKKIIEENFGDLILFQD
ncbi:hypothetical protein [Aquimarina brevivitae]|uniref:Uncharacterized protein n=1 Tax=Aquimarina brevivitae TaxID=323412 RepID=A0A4Q7P167_9FLAO|nr:hypothetical protein [Aquimarina brevivitae]RZS93561.1 hypothetical protein EV197_2141 [Aquimarina brevivitae]